MLVLLSPAKKLDFDAGPDVPLESHPELLAQTAELMKTVRGLSAKDLGKLMSLSPALAALNHERFQSFRAGKRAPGARPAALAFRGDTYVGLAPDDFTAKDFEFAHRHVRILSGLYGLLSPLDRIQPYRLEMGTRLRTPRGASLYDFWGDRITRAVRNAARDAEAKAIVNAASAEYFGAVRAEGLEVPVITPVFKEQRGQSSRTIGFCAKRARGMIARFVVKNRLKSPGKLRDFGEAGYRYREDLSSPTEYVFTRPETR